MLSIILVILGLIGLVLVVVKASDALLVFWGVALLFVNLWMMEGEKAKGPVRKPNGP